MGATLRILHVIASHRWTGAAEPAARTALGQTRAGHDTLFAMTTGSSLEERSLELGVNVTGRVPFERSYWPHRKLRELHLLQELVADFRPDVVHAHLTHDHIMAGAAIGPTGPGKPVLVRTWHREEPPRRDAFTRALVIKRTSGSIGVSGALCANIREAFDLPAERVARIGGSVDSDLFRPSDDGRARLRAKWGIPADAPVAGVVSRLRITRGIPWLLDAAEDFLAAVPNARLVICGQGSYKAEMLERLESHPRAAQIVYAGYVSGQDLLDSYSAFDVAFMLKPGNDGACRSALEAMACARPVIGGDLGAIHDLLAGSDDGWLVPADDRARLATATAEALSDPAAAIARGAKARSRIIRDCNLEAITRTTVGFYESLLRRRDSAA